MKQIKLGSPFEFTNTFQNQKTKKELDKKKFNLIEKALEDATLTLSSKVVLIRLLTKHHNNKTGRCDPAAETMATDLKMSERTIHYAIKQLKDCGWLSVQQRFNTSNQYHFNWDCVGSEVQNLQVEGGAKFASHRCKKRQDGVQKTTGWGAKSRNLTIERTNERTNEKNTHGGVCDSDSPSNDRNKKLAPKEDSNHIGNMKSLAASGSGLVQENGHEFLDSTTSLKESIPFDQEGYDADLAAFASLANFGPPDPPVSNSSPKELISTPHEDSFSRPFAYEFSELWRVWPPETKLHEEKAYKAFVDAVEQMDARTIVFAAYRYANYCRVKITRPEDKHYISKPENWLQYEKWKETTRQISGAVNDPNRPFIADETPPEQQQPASVPEQQMSVKEITGMTLEEMTGMTLEEINMQQAEATELAKMNQRW